MAEKHDDPSLLRDIIARVPRKKLDPGLLSVVVSQREDDGLEMLTMLLDHGLNINYRKKQRVSLRDQHDPWAGDAWYRLSLTALRMAAKKENKNAVSFLISRGAKVNEPEFYGATARDLALGAGHHEVVEILDQVAKPRDHK